MRRPGKVRAARQSRASPLAEGIQAPPRGTEEGMDEGCRAVDSATAVVKSPLAGKGPSALVDLIPLTASTATSRRQDLPPPDRS